MVEEKPQVFIPYSWSSIEHEEFVYGFSNLFGRRLFMNNHSTKDQGLVRYLNDILDENIAKTSEIF